MVFRMEVTSSEIIDTLDLRHNGPKATSYTLAPRSYENSDPNLMQKSFLPDDVKVNITIDDIRLRPNFTPLKTIKFTEKVFFLHNIRFYSTAIRSFR